MESLYCADENAPIDFGRLVQLYLRGGGIYEFREDFFDSFCGKIRIGNAKYVERAKADCESIASLVKPDKGCYINADQNKYECEYLGCKQSFNWPGITNDISLTQMKCKKIIRTMKTRKYIQ